MLGLLLAFRTSQSYERFWEARTLWDGVYSSTRSIVRLACATLQEPGLGLGLGLGSGVGLTNPNSKPNLTLT